MSLNDTPVAVYNRSPPGSAHTQSLPICFANSSHWLTSKSKTKTQEPTYHLLPTCFARCFVLQSLLPLLRPTRFINVIIPPDRQKTTSKTNFQASWRDSNQCEYNFSYASKSSVSYQIDILTHNQIAGLTFWGGSRCRRRGGGIWEDENVGECEWVDWLSGRKTRSWRYVCLL
jgi:hypothetical protein